MQMGKYHSFDVNRYLTCAFNISFHSREEELNNNIDDAAAHYPSMMWPQMYPMMMMMPMSPIGQQPGDSGQPGQMRMVQTNPPDIVHQRQETARQGVMSSYHHQEMEQRLAHENNQ